MSTTDLDPTEFVQSGRRLFIDTNIFMDNRSRWSGGLKRLFERTAPTIIAERNPIVVPMKVVRELEKYAGKRSSRVAEEQVEAVRRSRIALTFLEDAEARGLVRTDLGDDSARYADDSFLRVLEWAGDRYEMCVITDDITLQLRIRLRSAQLNRRFAVGTLTSDGLVAVEDDQSLFGRGNRKLDAKRQKVDDGTATFADRQDVDELTALLPEFQTPGGSSSNSGPAYVAHRTTILIETTNVVGPSGEIFVNGVSQGFTPVRLVSDTDEFGNILEDLEIIARWDDGRNESYYRLNRGSRPDPIIRFSPSSSGRDY